MKIIEINSNKNAFIKENEVQENMRKLSISENSEF